MEEKNNSTSSIAPRNNNNQRIYFEAYNRETGKKLVTGGFVDLNIDDSLPQSSDAKKRVVVIGEESEKVDDDNDNMVADDKNEVKCKIDDIFSGWLVTKIQENESVVKHVNTVYQFNITKEKKHCATWSKYYLVVLMIISSHTFNLCCPFYSAGPEELARRCLPRHAEARCSRLHADGGRRGDHQHLQGQGGCHAGVHERTAQGVGQHFGCAKVATNLVGKWLEGGVGRWCKCFESIGRR